MKQLSKYILHKAIQAGICQDWALKIGQTDNKDELLDMYIKGIDFCLDHNFPSNEDLLKFGGELLVKHGIWVDEEVTSENPGYLVLLGASNGVILVGDYTVSQLYIKHNSIATVACSGNSFTVIDCFDNSIVSITASGNCKVLINSYGSAKVVHECQGSAVVKIRNKNKATY
jgi:hypothetical protein